MTSKNKRWTHPTRAVLRWLLPTLLATLLSAACSMRSDDDLLASARKHIGERDFASATIELKNVLQKSPKSGEARFLLGTLLLDRGEAASAEAELQRAAEASYPEDLVLPKLAAALVAQQKGEQVVQQYGQKALSDPSAAAELATQVAAAQMANHALDGASSSLDRALQLAPAHVPARVLRARLTAQQGNMAGALAQANELLASAPGDASVWMLKGDLLQRPGQPDNAAALDAYRKAISLQRDLAQAHAMVLSMLIGKRDFEAAGKQLHELQMVRPQDPQTLFFEATLALQKGDAARTRAITQALLRVAPGSPPLLVLAGQAEMRLNAFGQAEALLGRAVKAAPDSAPPRRMLAEVYVRTGQIAKALAVLRPLLEGNSTDVDALALAGRAQLAAGDAVAAGASFARAARLRPDDSRVRTSIALLHFSKTGGEDALAELDAVTRTDMEGVSDMALISARLSRKEFDAALKAIDTLAAKQPKSALPDDLRGRIALQRGDPALARRHFEQALAKDPDHFPSVAMLVALDLADKKPSDATARVEALLKRRPTHLEAQLARIDLKARAGATRLEQRAMLEDLVRVNPLDPAAHLALIDLTLADGDARRALAVARAAGAGLPDDVELVERLGRAQQAAGELVQAESTLQRLADLQPGRAQPFLRLAEIQLLRDQAGAARESIRRARAIEPDNADALRAALAMELRENHPAQAMALAHEMQARRPGDVLGVILQGDVEAHQSHWAQAQSAYRAALAKAPQSVEAALRLHGALVQGGKGGEAEQLAARWQADHPQDLSFLHQRASDTLERGDWPSAEALYRELQKQRPDDVVALNNLAVALVRQGKAGAVPLAERAVQLVPGQATLVDTLAMALAAEQQLPKAIEWQRRAVDLAPLAVNLRMNLVKLYLQSGDQGRARDELAQVAKARPAYPNQAELARLQSELGTAPPSDSARAPSAIEPTARPSNPPAPTSTPAPGAATDTSKIALLAGALLASLVAIGIPVVLVMAAMRPQVFRVERSAHVDAPAQRLFDLMTDLHHWERWSALEPFDTSMTRHFAAAASGLGAVCKWVGPGKSSEGYMEVVKCVAPKDLTLTINHARPNELCEVREYVLSAEPGGGTLVRAIAGGPASYGQRVVGLVWRTDRHIGHELSAELGRLKNLAEAAQAPASVDGPGSDPAALGPAAVAG